MPTFPKTRQLGREPSRHDPRTLRLLKYVNYDFLPAPDVRRWDAPITDWGVMGNDRYGNCVFATAAHEILTWRANAAQDSRRISDAAVINLARDLGGLHGYSILARLKYWRKKEMWANSLRAFALTDTRNPTQLRQLINAFGCLDIGLLLPVAWTRQPIWDTGKGPDYRPNSWGSHSVPIVAYDTELFYVVTWGKLQPITAQALAKYCDEAYALIDPDWLTTQGITPAGFDLKTLDADLLHV
jgi:hypothetical protein